MLEGKFICTKSADEKFMSVGEKYVFESGMARMNNGRHSPSYKTLEDFHIINRDEYKIEEYTDNLWDKYCKVGNVVEFTDGSMWFILPDKLISKDGWSNIKKYNKHTLKHVNGVKYDIVKVYESPVVGSFSWNFMSEGDTSHLIKIWDKKAQEEQNKLKSKLVYLESQIADIKKALADCE